MQRRQLVLPILMAFLLVGSAGAVTGTASSAASSAAAPTGTSSTDNGASGHQQPAQQRAGTACDYSALYDETIESVVSIQTSAGLGSGFVYRLDNGTSYVLTNAHVVGQASGVTVQFDRGEQRLATVVGQDVYSDLAVVRVNETPGYVQALPVSDAQPEHGQRVAAFGSPLGFEATITHGIVSGVNRSMPTQRGFAIPNVVQTDAPISPGSSGGPLVACDGDVIGVNTAGIAARGAENIGFAVPASVVERVVPSLIETGDFAHPYLGISATSVTPALADANNLNVTQGVMVVSVADDVPAADDLQGATGLANESGRIVPVGGDVVVAAESRPVETAEDLRSILLTEVRPGDEITLTVLRDGERIEVTTTVTDRPEPTMT